VSDSLLAYRDRFPILGATTYLNNNSLGPMPGEVAEQVRAYAETWASRGGRAWAEAWWALPAAVGDLVAPLLGVRPGTVSTHPNVTLATAVFFSCLAPTARRSKVVTTELQFPSVLYFLQRWCDGHGVRLEIVPAPDGIGVDPQRLLEAVDTRTLAVAISHAEFKSAFLNDAAAVAQRCREVGALLVLDVFQSAGVVPLEAEAWGVDACVGGCLKWLCGGPGNAYLYVTPELARRLEPQLTGWMAHPAPFVFAPPPMRWRDDAWRFLNGTPPIACLYCAVPGLKLHHEVGVPAIRAKSRRLTALLYDAARAQGWRVHAPADPDRRGGTVAVDVPHGELVAQELLARDILVDYRPDAGIRLSPHFFNSADECHHALTQIAEILQTRAFARHAAAGGATPT
jgi:kynureninase